jgi:excisionase family DNA binding protein
MKKSPPSGKVYNRPAEEAKRLHISIRLLKRWMHEETIPYLKIGRVVLFDPQAVDAALSAAHSKNHET